MVYNGNIVKPLISYIIWLWLKHDARPARLGIVPRGHLLHGDTHRQRVELARGVRGQDGRLSERCNASW